MDFSLNEKQRQIIERARQYAAEYLAPTVVQRDEACEYSMEAFNKLGELGFIGLPYDAQYGGTEGGYLEYVLAVEEISKVEGAMGNSFSVCASLFCGPLNRFGTEAQKKKFMPPVLKGEALGAFCLTEAEAGSDASRIETTALRDGDDYIVNGVKCFITNAPIAGYYLLIAATNPEAGIKGLSALIVDRNSPGIRMGRFENKMGIRPVQVSEVIFENVRVPAENLLGKEGEGFKIAMNTLDDGRLGVAAQALGIAGGAFEIARKHLMQREQFGKPLYKNQYLAFKMAELKIKLEQARLLLHKAVFVKESGQRYTTDAAMAKYVCSNLAMEVTTEAVQMLGGRGYMKEYHVERMMRDAKITQIYEGTNEIQKLIVGGDIFK